MKPTASTYCLKILWRLDRLQVAYSEVLLTPILLELEHFWPFTRIGVHDARMTFYDGRT